MIAEHVTVVNRSTKTLTGTWDGVARSYAPGKHSMPRPIAEAFKRQNPIMGSEDPSTYTMQFLVGIEEEGDDCSPIEQSNAIERWDRKYMPNARPVQVVKGDNGIYSARDLHQSLPLGTEFTHD